MRALEKAFTIVAVIAIVLVALGLVVWLTEPGAVGNPADYNFAYGDCGRLDTPFPNNNGIVADLRQVECNGIPGSTVTRDYYVFVHPSRAKNSGSNLALRYGETIDNGLDYGPDGYQPNWVIAPRITWESPTSLQISMGTPSPGGFPRLMRYHIGDIQVTYVIGRGGVRISPDNRFPSKGWTEFGPLGW